VLRFEELLVHFKVHIICGTNGTLWSQERFDLKRLHLLFLVNGQNKLQRVH
jgi:hypothetical protein